MKLPPSIIQRNILVDVPDDYGSYLYKFTDTKHPLQAPYIGIKKDKLPEHGGKFYWGSSENEEFNLLVQGNEPRFIYEILDLRKRADYNYLQLKEYRMLKKYPNIRTNTATYNLSYGIPPVPANGMVSEEFLEWYHEMKDSGIWTSKQDESIKYLLDMNTVQIRYEDDPNFVKHLTAEIIKVGGNTSEMNAVLIFEGIGEKFGFDKGTDVIVGSRHGLQAAKKAGSLGMKTIRVPNEVLEDKSEHFLRTLASNDNFAGDIPLRYIPTKEDGAKFLVSLYDAHGIEPTSDIAKHQLDITYGFKTKKKSDAIDMAVTDIKMKKKGNTKWKYWTKDELEDIKRTKTIDDRLAMYMSSGMYDYRKIMIELYNDATLKKRTTIWVYIHHPSTKWKETWKLENSDYEKQLKWMFGDRFKIEFKQLESEIDDTTKY
jgi:hypothetical protein